MGDVKTKPETAVNDKSEQNRIGELFDPQAELSVYEHCRPHWSQAGAIVFLTFRTHDSIPKEVIERWNREKLQWLVERQLANADQDWHEVVAFLQRDQRTRFNRQFDRCREVFLDTCHGDCVLKRPELSQIVADSLLYFDGQRYKLGDFVVMPNHVHVLVAFASPELLKQQCDSWLHYTAVQINKRLGVKGKFWQQEPFDHFVRSPKQYDYLRGYIRNNPYKAGLAPGEYHYRSYDT
ncbi:MAG: transposase [Pirellulaceae bacterium]